MARAAGSSGESEPAHEPPASNLQDSTDPETSAPSDPEAFDASILSRAMSKLAAFESYSELLAVQNKQPSLLTAAVLIARHRYPDVNEKECSAAIEEIVEAVRKQLPPSPYPLKIVNTIIKVMYSSTESGGLGWTGNDVDYQSPNNSCINRVLASRSGEADGVRTWSDSLVRLNCCVSAARICQPNSCLYVWATLHPMC